MEKKRLDELCSTFKSEILVNKIEKNTGEYPVFGAKGAITGIDSFQQDKSYISIIKWGAGVGRAEIKPAYSSIVATMLGVIPNDDVDIDWLCYLLQSMHLEQYATNAVVPNLYFRDYCDIPVNVPNKSEQESIALVLNTCKGIINKREQQLSIFDELIKARFVEMFGTVDNNVFDYPVVRLGDYAKLQGGYAFKSKDFVDEGIPLVQIGNVNKDYLDWEVINAVPEEFLDRYREFSLCDGDLVMAMTRPIIKSLNSVKIAKVSKSDVPCLLNQRVGRFVLSDSLDKLFLETLCKSDDFKDYVERMSGNSLQPNISSKQVEDYMIILPPIDLQERFAEFVKQVDKSKVAVQKALDETRILFGSLIQEYFG